MGGCTGVNPKYCDDAKPCPNGPRCNPHVRYYGVPMNGPALRLFRFQVGRLRYRSLRRRSQKTRLTWERMRRLIDRWLPPARVCHPYP